ITLGSLLFTLHDPLCRINTLCKITTCRFRLLTKSDPKLSFSKANPFYLFAPEIAPPDNDAAANADRTHPHKS
ncbi:unnamed protein product, partial [Tenebrio molitor]